MVNLKLGQGKKSVEEALSYAVGHRIRIEVLAALNERCYSKAELAEILQRSIPLVTHHVDELSAEGSIEVANVEWVEDKNLKITYYRAIKMPFFSDEEIAAMTPEQRRVTIGVPLQAIMAESLAAFWAGKMEEDPRLTLAWNWFNVDAQGREEIADELAESWERVQEIEARATDRRVESGEDAVSIIVTSLGFPRGRNSPTPPDTNIGGKGLLTDS